MGRSDRRTTHATQQRAARGNSAIGSTDGTAHTDSDRLPDSRERTERTERKDCPAVPVLRAGRTRTPSGKA